MTKKRHKLRLRKQVIMSIPIVLFFIIIATFFAINRKNVFASKGSGTAKIIETKSSNEVDDIINLSERDIFVDLADASQLRTKDNTVIYYAQKFKLNVDKTLEIAHNLTNNYQDEEFNQNFIIATDQYKSKIKPFNSFEAGIVFFVRDLYRYPQRYGATIEEIRTSEEIDASRTIKDNIIYLDGLTFYQYLGKISDLYGIDKELGLAISYQETGILTSKLFVNSNNMGGQKGSNGWMRFPTLEAGIISFVLSLKNIIESYEVDMTREDSIYLLSGPYVNGTTSIISTSWAEKVTYFKNKIHEQDLFSI